MQYWYQSASDDAPSPYSSECDWAFEIEVLERLPYFSCTQDEYKTNAERFWWDSTCSLRKKYNTISELFN